MGHCCATPHDKGVGVGDFGVVGLPGLQAAKLTHMDVEWRRAFFFPGEVHCVSWGSTCSTLFLHFPDFLVFAMCSLTEGCPEDCELATVHGANLKAYQSQQHTFACAEALCLEDRNPQVQQW